MNVHICLPKKNDLHSEKSSYFRILAGIAAVALFANAVSAANVLTNPGFETDAVLNAAPVPGATGWNAFNGAATASANSSPTHSGIGSLVLSGGGGFSVPGAFQTFPASPGDLWDFQGYMQTTNAFPGDATSGLIKIVWNDGVNDLDPVVVNVGNPVTGSNPGIEGLPKLDANAAVGSWIFTHAQGIAPPGTTQVKVFVLVVDQSAATGFFDDLQVTNAPASSSSQNVIANGGFETDAVSNAAPIAGAAGWTAFGGAATASATNAPTHSGIGSLMLAGSGGFTVPGVYQTFATSPGQVWDLRGYALTTNALSADATFGELKIVWSDGVNDLQPGTVNIGTPLTGANPGIESTPKLDASAPANTWVFLHAQGVAPAGATQVKLYALFVDQSAGTGFFDDVQGGLPAAAAPTIQGTVVSGSSITMQSTSENGFNYVLQSAPSLSNPSWTDVLTNAGTGSALIFSVPFSPGTPVSFFRIRVQ